MEENKSVERQSLQNCTPRELADAIAEVLDNKKARDVKVLSVADKTVIADYFVIATGNTGTHVRSLADEVEYQIRERDVEPSRYESRPGTAWRTLDYSSVIVHIFDRESRDFYKLDKLYTEQI